MFNNGFTGLLTLRAPDTWIKPDDTLSDNLVAPHITGAAGWDYLSDGVIPEYGVPDRNGNPNAMRATLADNRNYFKFNLSSPLDVGYTYRMIVDVRTPNDNFDGVFEMSYYDDTIRVIRNEINLSRDWRVRIFDFVVPDQPVADPVIRVIGYDNGVAGNVVEIGQVELYKIREPVQADNNFTNILPEPYVNTITGNWNDVDRGSLQVVGVPDQNGDPVATEVFFKDDVNRYVWYDLASPLPVGTRYNMEVWVCPGTRGYEGKFQGSYYDGSNRLADAEQRLVNGWQKLTLSFTAQEAPLNDPSIRLIGWNRPSAESSIIIGRVTVYNFDELRQSTGLTAMLGNEVKDPVNYPYTAIHFFKVSDPTSRAPLVYNPKPSTMDYKKWVTEGLKATKTYNEENSEMRPASEAPFDENFIRTTCIGGLSGTDGGTGWENRVVSLESACLTYRVRFQPGYEWVKGGKLPGLFGGNSPSGGDPARNGFSTRMMWRKNAQGELYLYAANKNIDYGASIGRGSFFFQDDYWHEIKQEVILNTIGPNGEIYGDGRFRLWIDGNDIFEVDGIIFRERSDIKIEGIMYTIFYGGSGSDWAPTNDNYVETGDYRIYGPTV